MRRRAGVACCGALAAACAWITASCGGGAGSNTTLAGPHTYPSPASSQSPTPLPSPSFTPASKIQHVVIIVQENRSFDNLFHGFPGADYATQGQLSDGEWVPLTSIGLDKGYDLRHRHLTWWDSYDNGKMDGFDVDRNPDSPPEVAYHYVDPNDLGPYWQMATSYVLADRMFQSNTSGSYPAHLYLVAAQSDDVIGNPNYTPWGCDAPPGTTATRVAPGGKEAPGPFPCFTYRTIADLMDAKGMTWRMYTPSSTEGGSDWDSFDSFKAVRYGPDWSNDVIKPETRVLTDVATGQLAQVTWVIPSGANSDHPGDYSKTGPQWVASVVNAIGASPMWSSTAIFITWDDWGGFYDHVPPPQLDEMGLSFRVPLIVVSPYAKHGYVSHVQHEFGSILRFTEENFGLPSLGESDARADNLNDCFDFTQSPAPYARVRSRLAPGYFLTHIDRSPPDDDL